jgi:hypothetical protein
MPIIMLHDLAEGKKAAVVIEAALVDFLRVPQRP